jgi:hypothetical protein
MFWPGLFLRAKFFQSLDAALVLRIEIDGFLVVLDSRFFLSRFQVGLSQTVVSVPKLRIILHPLLKYLDGRVGLADDPIRTISRSSLQYRSCRFRRRCRER